MWSEIKFLFKIVVQTQSRLYWFGLFLLCAAEAAAFVTIFLTHGFFKALAVATIISVAGICALAGFATKAES